MYISRFLNIAGFPSLAHLGHEMGVAAETIRDWERGDRFPRRSHMLLLRELLGVPVDVLLGFDAEPMRKQQKQMQLTPLMRNSHRLYDAVTQDGYFTAEKLWQLSRAYSKLTGNKISPFEIYLRRLSEELAVLEKAMRATGKPKARKKKHLSPQQLSLFSGDPTQCL